MATVTKFRFVIPLFFGLLGSRGGQAQSRPAPPPAETTTDVNVRVTLPAALDALKDYTLILVSKDQDKLRNLAARGKQPNKSPVLTFSVALPRSWVNRLAGKK